MKKTTSKTTKSPFFVGFLTGTVVSCLIAVYFGLVVVPGMHDERNPDLSHGKQHPSFDAPNALVFQKDNAMHQKEFEKAYNFPRDELTTKDDPMRKDELKDKEGGSEKEQSNHNSNHESNTNTNPNPNPTNQKYQKYHVVFSTSCSPFQNWQALAFFYFARKVRQPGTVTRLVSGCTDAQSADLKRIHSERVQPLAIPGLQTFELHITPAFDDSKGGDQKYWNKPNGLLHWMEESLGFGSGLGLGLDGSNTGHEDGSNTGSNHGSNHGHEDDDAIVILTDPDMMLLRPITAVFTPENYAGGWTVTGNGNGNHNGNDATLDDDDDDAHVVTHGHPFAQQYGFGDAWLTSLNGRLDEVVPPGSPALNVSKKDARNYYPAGPPYVATAKDMYRIAVQWVRFLPKVHAIFPDFMCEMHAYSVAAAHLELPHKLGKGFIVSDVESAGGENFGFVLDHLDKETVCMAPPEFFSDSSKSESRLGLGLESESESSNFDANAYDPTDATALVDPIYAKHGIRTNTLPFVLHYCQRYALGRWFFSKYKLPEPIFEDCDSPMLREPPSNVAQTYDWSVFPNGHEMNDFAGTNYSNSSKGEDWKAKVFRERHITNGWMLCAVLLGINEAIAAYRTETCGNPNDHPQFFRKTFHFHNDTLFQQSIDDPSIPRDVFEAAGNWVRN